MANFTSMPEITNHSFVIAVPNLEKSAAFYRDVLGFRIDSIPDPGWLFYRSGGCTIMAGECPDALPPAELGDHAYFAYFQVEDIDLLHQSVRAAGAEICKTVRDEPWQMREFGVVTADGHKIMFAMPICQGTNDA
jgi:catechol 2,3-dioxygenase-like lactoylglutathione lyase family enzyme